MNLHNSVIFITGAAKRIGRTLACEIAKKKAHLILHYHSSEKEAQELKAGLESQSVQVLLLRANLTNCKQVQQLAEAAWAWKGRVDSIIHNASAFYPTTLGQTTEAQWDELFAVNAKAPYFLSQILGLRMKAQGYGRIVNLADNAALKPYPTYLPYCASKAALLNLTYGLAQELAPEVTVNAILPGVVLWPEGFSESLKKKILAKTPLHRETTPEDLAQWVIRLLESESTTGASIQIDGGYWLSHGS